MKNILVIIVLLLSGETFSQTQWSRTNGPEGISVNRLVNIAGNIYACTETDGLYFSNDDGQNWNALNSGMETMNIRDVISVPGYLLVATFGQGVWRSPDGGQTWLPSNNYSNLFIQDIDANDDYIFAGASSEGIYRSSDNGQNWTQLFGNVSVMSLAVTTNKIFVSEYNYTYYSTDNGNTWDYVNSLTGAAPWSYFISGDTIIIGGVNKIYRSTNEGASFTPMNLGFPYTITNVYAITMAGSNLYAATSYYGVIKSTDFGNNWSTSTYGMGPKNTRGITYNGSTLIAGTNYSGLYRSTDLGTNWNKSNNGLPAASTIASMVISDNVVFAGTRDGVYKTTDNGISWSKMTGTNDTINYGTIRGICEKDGDIYAGVIYQFNSTVYKSTDKGETWVRRGNGLPSDLTFINGIESVGNNVIAATDEGIYYSTDDGMNWNQSNIPADFIEGIATSDGYAYAILQFVGLYRSFDNGINWSYFRPATADHISITARNSYIFVGSFFEDAIYSPNYGNSWYECAGFPPETAAFGFGLVNDNLFLVGTDVSSNYIYASTDGGNYFTPYSEGLGPNAVTEFFAINDTYIFAGTDYNGVWRRLRPDPVPVELVSFSANLVDNKVKLEWTTATETNNKGFAVERFAESLNENWNEVGFIEGNGTTTEPQTYSFFDGDLSNGKYKYRLKQIDYDGSFEYSDIVEVSFMEPSVFSLEQNYPNPFNPTTTIEYSIPESGNVKLIIYNSLGEVVETLVNKFEEAGTYNISFDGLNLSSGIYFYRIEAEEFYSIKKMILLK